MTTSTEIDIIKENIYEKLSDIEDKNVLQAINTLIDNLNTNSSTNKDTKKRDLTGYIKEWAKNM